MGEAIKKLLGIEPMTKSEKKSVLLCIPVCLFMFALIYLAALLG